MPFFSRSVLENFASSPIVWHPACVGTAVSLIETSILITSIKGNQTDSVSEVSCDEMSNHAEHRDISTLKRVKNATSATLRL
jgi:hypothetical protein